MLSQDQFLAAVKKECAIIKHLIAQVPANGWEYRPTPPQRSTIELARYLAHVPSNVAVYATTGTWDHWEKLEGPAKSFTPEQCAKAMDQQPKAIAKLLKKFTPAKLKKATVKDFGGKKVALSEFLLGGILGVLTAYRMQLFLYAKSAGNADLTTSDCWHGKKAKPQKAAAT
jgi:hypothetical protein